MSLFWRQAASKSLFRNIEKLPTSYFLSFLYAYGVANASTSYAGQF